MITNKWKATAITLMVIILLLGIIYCWPLVANNIYEDAYQLGYYEGSATTIVKINQEGNIPIIQQLENDTTVQWYSILEICQAQLNTQEVNQNG